MGTPRSSAGGASAAKRWALDQVEKRRGDLVDLCARLVRIPSENPPGDTTRVAAFVARALRRMGLAPRVYEPRRGMPNVVATLGTGRPNLLVGIIVV
jgi:succinyl-diaminopimelate desuccinylase